MAGFYTNLTAGPIVIVVVQGTPAFQANVLEGDVILKLANEDVVDVQTLSALALKYAGRTVELQILRNDQPKTISVALRPNLFQ
jgi:S1-C subfamily serine protease